MSHRFFFLLLLAGLLHSCSASKKATQPLADIKSLVFLDDYTIPFNTRIDSTDVGGLSGIDYDPVHDRYFFISDDRSDHNPARFYTGKIEILAKGFEKVSLTGVTSMRQADGELYPNNKQDRLHTPDPEAIRYDARRGQWVWTSEGERIVKAQDTVLEDPAITIMDASGHYLGSYPLPANLHMQAIEKGPRQNGVLEGMSFADNYKTLYVNVEEPLYEDGPRADVTDNKAYIRLLKFDAATKKNTAQFAYKLEPVAWPANPPTAFRINGVPDILSLGKNKLLVIERSYSTGRINCSIKVFIADLEGATDITGQSLQQFTSFKPVSKKLLVDMDEQGLETDNIEGVTFGPVLPDGHKTLIFVSDNNFSPLQKTQLLLFEIKE